MSITPETLRLAGALRIEVGAAVDDATRKAVTSWVRAWDEVSQELSAAVDDLLAVGDGQWPTRAQISRATRAQAALAHAESQLAALAEDVRAAVTDAAAAAVETGSAGQPRLIASQLPRTAGPSAVLAASFDRVSTRAIDAIVARVAGQVTSLTKPLAPEAAEAMRRALVRGVAVGDNPRVAAARMLRGLEGGFNGGLTRALTIARTEILDAHRDGSAAQQQANADTLAGWTWVAELDRRTCPSCFSQHGTDHPLSEPGPIDHQQGRCARVPKTKSWRELGFDLPEPPSVLPDARATFDAMPEADQLAVMGRARLDGLRSGQVGWGDLSTRRSSDGWRDSMVPTPLKDLLPAA